MVSVETYQTMAEAASAMREDTRFLGGGTIVMRAVNYGDQSFEKIVCARDVERGVKSDASGLRIGAATTMADILASGDVGFLHPVARAIGGPAIRNMATLGGNLFALNPYGDMAAALLALGAETVMADGQTRAVEQFLNERDTSRGLVQAVVIPRVETGAFRFAKVTRIKPKGVSMMSVSALLRRGDPRIVFGNMGPVPMRAKAAEAALAQGVDAASIAAACAVCTQGLSPVDDALASAWYRAEVAPVHLKRLLEQAGA